MTKAKSTWRQVNKKIDSLWSGTPEYCARQYRAGTRQERAADFWKKHYPDLIFVLLMGCLLFGLSWILPFNQGPDEEMRYMIPTYIYKHGTLPDGRDPEIRHELWGISYAFHPILPYILGGYLMKLVSIFSTSDKALLMAARFVNILIGMGFYWYVVQISRKLFRRKLFRTYFIALLALLPQLLYLFVYVNTDGIAVFSSAIIIYYWLEGLEHHWDRRSCTGLAVGVAVCALSYFNAYGYGLLSAVLFVGSLIVFYRKCKAGKCIGVILKRGIYIAVLVFLMAGWWFIYCGVLYDGDFLGMRVVDECAELYAQEEFKPSNRPSLQEQGVPLEEMLKLEEEGGMEWARTTWRSFIGYFGFFEHPLGIDIYEIHKRLLGLGLAGILLEIGLAVLYCLKRLLQGADGKNSLLQSTEPVIRRPELSLPGGGTHWMNFLLLQFSFGCCIIIPILLSLYNSYCGDFQPQGRYIMPLVIPLMYFATRGTEQFLTLFFRKWFVYIMMVPLFYAALHVFLGAFVSVYIPAYCETLASWADIRFLWFSNVPFIAKLVQYLIPG